MSAYSDAVVADGASHYWRLNETASGILADSIGTAQGASSGPIDFSQPGVLADDAAMHFNGAARIEVAQQLHFENNFSVECWFKLDPGTWAGTTLPLVCTQLLPGQGQFWLELLDGGQTLRAQIADTPTTTTFLIADTGKGLDGLVDGMWHHLVWVFPLNLPRVAVYLDGVALAVNTPSTLFYAVTPVYFAY